MDADLPENLVECTLSVNQEAILAYAAITDDYNPIHVDPDFASRTAFSGVIAHGMLSVNLLWQALRRTLGATAMKHMALNVRFVKPVRLDDRLRAGGSRIPNSLGYDIWIRNQNSEPVIIGRATLTPDSRR